MQDKQLDFYTEAHLIVAAIRIFDHLNSRPPNAAELSRTIDFSIERCSYLCRKLEDLGVIEAVEGSYSARLYVRNHLNIEDIPRGEPESTMEDELKKFQDNQKAFSQKMEMLQAEQKKKKKSLFADMEKKLKEEIEKKKAP
jgi:hypothetical protein